MDQLHLEDQGTGNNA